MTTWIVVVEWLARIILFGLIGLSIWSIAIIIDRRRFFRSFVQQGDHEALFDWIETRNKKALVDWAQKTDGWRAVMVSTLLAGDAALGGGDPSREMERVERLMVSQWLRQRAKLEEGLSVLGTLGSTTPFVGLLGTILGIIVSFGALSEGQIDSQKIMYSLAEALLLTAVGLGVAIPAVVAYNYFSRRVVDFLRESDALKEALVAQFTGRL